VSYGPGHRPVQAPLWTAAQTAEDLLSLVEDAIVAGWSIDEIVDTLTIQGLDQATSTALLDETRDAAQAAGRLDNPPDESASAQTFIDLTPSVRWIRAPGDPLTIDDDRVEMLAKALAKAGLSASTANAIASEIAAHERLLLDVYRTRMRRLAVQGMVAGGLFTSFFVWAAVVGGGTAYWHLLTASLTSLLTIYSIVLYRNGRPPKIR